jgi:hypothetical protein
LPDCYLIPDAIRARGPAENPVTLRYRDGRLQLWSHADDGYVDLDNPPDDVTIWRELPFELLPPKAQEYVRTVSRHNTARSQGASPTYLNTLKMRAATLLRELNHEHTSTLRANVGNRPSVQNSLTRIRNGGVYTLSRVPTR